MNLKSNNMQTGDIVVEKYPDREIITYQLLSFPAKDALECLGLSRCLHVKIDAEGNILQKGKVYMIPISILTKWKKKKPENLISRILNFHF